MLVLVTDLCAAASITDGTNTHSITTLFATGMSTRASILWVVFEN